MTNVYYLHALPLGYNSGQTIQVIQDYKNLSALGYRIFFYGMYDDPKALQPILDDIVGLPIHVDLREGFTSWNRAWLKCRMLFHMMMDPHDKIVVARNVSKISDALAWKPFLRRAQFFWERHEDAIPYLLQNFGPTKRAKEKAKMQRIFGKLDGLILTNYSQEQIMQEEFGNLPRFAVLPNGVNIPTFAQARPNPASHILTYTGQFSRWKNVELLFQALALLDSSYRLRIAGGKGDAASRAWVEDKARRFGLQGRVDFLGFLPPTEIACKALAGSSVLLLPLGDNIESKFFTSPMKLFEYMATSIPVVAVDYPSVRGITGENTVYLSNNNAQAFADAIELAINDPQQSKRVAAMNTIATQYSFVERTKAMDRFLQASQH